MERIRHTAEIISGWTKEAGTMLPKSPEEINALIESNRAVLIWNGNGSPAAFAAISFDWPEDWKELGAVIVEPGHRQRGLGHQIVAELIAKAKEEYPETNLFALCNEKSLKLFLDNGAEIIQDPNLLPQEVWGECVNCPKRLEAQSAGKLCCDTPVKVK